MFYLYIEASWLVMATVVYKISLMSEYGFPFKDAGDSKLSSGFSSTLMGPRYR